MISEKTKYNKLYYKKNKARELERAKKWAVDNRDKRRASLKKYYRENPWMNAYRGAKARCNNQNNNRYNSYGKRGIKFLLTKEELKKLWFRDKAFNMIKPSIDRINNDGNYEFNNCRFIELKANLLKRHSKI